MDDGIGTELILIAVCIILSGFFSFLETALTTLGDLRIHNIINQNKRANILNLWLDEQDKLLNTILFGNTAAIVTASILAANVASRYVQWHTAFIIGAVASVILMIGEVIPKTIARNRPQSFIIFHMYILRAFCWLFYPITFVMSIFGSLIVTITGKDEKTITEDDLAYILDVSEEQGVLEEQKQQMISSILDISDTQVREVMVPRIDMVAVSSDITKDKLLEIFSESEHSRVPVYDDTLDNITGILYMKDMIKLIGQDWDIEKYMTTSHSVHFVPETKRVDELLKEFQRERIQMAVVVDEYGGVAGLVTMEDILEEIVGDIWDEYDDDVRQEIVQLSDIEYRIDARMNIDDFCEYFELDRTEDMSDFDTAGGLVYDVAGAIPSVGDRFRWRGYEIIPLKMSDNKLEEFEFIKLPAEEPIQEEVVDAG